MDKKIEQRANLIFNQIIELRNELAIKKMISKINEEEQVLLSYLEKCGHDYIPVTDAIYYSKPFKFMIKVGD